jgi:hypothetical protein
MHVRRIPGAQAGVRDDERNRDFLLCVEDAGGLPAQCERQRVGRCGNARATCRREGRRSEDGRKRDSGIRIIG